MTSPCEDLVLTGTVSDIVYVQRAVFTTFDIPGHIDGEDEGVEHNVTPLAEFSFHANENDHHFK
jgi:hypothetical protein